METAAAAAAAARQHGRLGLACLSHRLARQFTAAHGGAAPNLVFSPLSIYSALSLVAAGAQGKTLRELLDLLGAPSREGLDVSVKDMVEQAIPPASTQDYGGTRVNYASGLWHDSARTLKPAYRDVAAASFRSVVRAVDFLSKPEEAVTQINSWVAESTNNLIDSIVDRSSVNSISAASLVVANAIYFKGSWKSPFNEERTEEDKFHRLDGSVVDAQFMNSFKSQFIGVHDGFKLLRMPYLPPCLPTTTVPRPRRYSMCVLLPDARDGLQSVMDAVAASGPSFLQDNLPLHEVEVGEFRVPRFKLSFAKSMSEDLQDLGVQAVFSEAAELPDLLEEDDESHEPLFLGDVLHKAVIEVNEEGTAAAAVTGCFVKTKCAWRPQPPPLIVDFVADHPFSFFVVEELSGAILFAGHVLDHTQGSC